MSTRSYTQRKRQASADQTRAQIVAAARQVRGADAGTAGFSVDAVAQAAHVARMTVYQRFGSRAGRLESVFDDLATRGGIAQRLPAAMAQSGPLLAFAAFVSAFGHFWDADRIIMRRLHAIAALDAEIGAGKQAREERRRGAAGVLVRRLSERYGRPLEKD